MAAVRRIEAKSASGLSKRVTRVGRVRRAATKSNACDIGPVDDPDEEPAAPDDEFSIPAITQ
jgi:hypothetical protein